MALSQSLEHNLVNNIVQLGNPAEGVPPLRLLSGDQVSHFDKGGSCLYLYRMTRVMNFVKHYALKRGVWEQN